MTQNNSFNDDIFNAILKSALADYAKEREREIENVFSGHYVDGPEIKPQKKFDRKIKRLIRSARRNTKPSVRYFPKYVKAAAGCACAAGIGIGATAIHADANGFTLFEWMFDRNTTYTSMELIQTMEQSCSDAIFGSGQGWKFFYFPQNLPSGYKISNYSINSKMCEITYANDTSKIVFTQILINDSNSGPSGLFDTENAAGISSIDIGGYKAHYNKKNNEIMISYNNYECYFDFTFTNVPKSKAIKVAENLKKITL